jgi:small-conductance mechanosensitive channel
MTYLSAARTVQRTASQNLTDMVAIGHSIATIKRNKLDLEQVNNDAIQQRQQKQTVLHQEQSQRLDNLLEENRKLFNALMETAVEVANIESFNEFERLDTLSRLVSLAEIAKKTEKIHLP